MPICVTAYKLFQKAVVLPRLTDALAFGIIAALTVSPPRVPTDVKLEVTTVDFNVVPVSVLASAVRVYVPPNPQVTPFKVMLPPVIEPAPTLVNPEPSP